MDPLSVVLVLVAVAVTLFAITGPLRGGRTEEVVERESLQIADLEAAKDAKYGEIRDAELDLRTGKLSQEDWRVIDRELRAEAVELLRQLDKVGAADAKRMARPAATE
jgi:hypothetical protein